MEKNRDLVDNLNYEQKVERSLDLITDTYKEYGDALVVANSLGKDSSVVWHMAKHISKDIRGFIVTTRYKPIETVNFMREEVARYPELQVFENDDEMPSSLYETDPDACCHALKVKPIKEAVQNMGVKCWVTGLRCTEGHTREDFSETEERDDGLIKLNPILIFHEREVWQYLALNGVKVNPLYASGYRSLGCAPCSSKGNSTGGERDGRWLGTSKCGGECGIHTSPLLGSE